MKSFKEFCNESIDLGYMINNWASQDEDSGEFLSGMCYTFARALYVMTGKKGVMWLAQDEDGNEHAFLELNKKYYDANGKHGTKDAVINDGDMSIDLKSVKYKQLSEDDIKSYKMAGADDDRLIGLIIKDIKDVNNKSKK